MAKARKRTRTGGRAPKKKAASRRSKLPASVDDASATQQAKLFRAVARVVKEHGFVNEIAAIHLKPTRAGIRAPARVRKRGGVRAAAVARTRDAGCPPGQVARVVCFKKPNGTVVCQLQCQPI